MDEDLRRRLRAHRPAIRREWEALLRAEPVATPLANPDVLSHLINRTLNVVLGSLRAPGRHRWDGPPGSDADIRAECSCGRNPLLAYYRAGERALREAIALLSDGAPGMTAVTRDEAVSEVCAVLRDIARRDVGLFCSLCQLRGARMQTDPAAQAARAAIGARVRAPATRRHGGAQVRAGGRPLGRRVQASAILQPAPWRRA